MKFPMLTPYQFASNTPIQAIDLDGKEALVVTGGVNLFTLFVGYDIGAGFAISPTGIAAYAGETLKGGGGLEIGAGGTVSFFPAMTDLNDLNGVSKGFSISGGALGKFGGGMVKSSGKWGGTFSAGVGVGAHTSVDLGITIFLKVVTWDKIAANIKDGTEDGNALAKAFGINKSNLNSAVTIIKNYYKKTVAGIIDKRINDLENNINNNAATITAADKFLNVYNKSGWLYKLFYKSEKKLANDIKNSAVKENVENRNEIKELQTTKKKVSE